MKNEFALLNFARCLLQKNICWDDQSPNFDQRQWDKAVRSLGGELNLDPDVIEIKIDYLKQIYLKERQKLIYDKNYKLKAWYKAAEKMFIRPTSPKKVPDCNHIYIDSDDDIVSDLPTPLMVTEPAAATEGPKDNPSTKSTKTNPEMVCREDKSCCQNKDPSLVSFGQYLVTLMSQLPVKKCLELQKKFVEETIDSMNKPNKKGKIDYIDIIEQ